MFGLFAIARRGWCVIDGSMSYFPASCILKQGPVSRSVYSARIVVYPLCSVLISTRPSRITDA